MRLKFNRFYIILVTAGLVVGLALFVFGATGHSLFVKTAGDPQETVNQFFSAVCAGNYDEACSLLSNYSDLGLSNRPDSDSGALLYDALAASRSYSLEGDCKISGTEAVQQVRFSFLDVDAAQAKAVSGFEAAFDSVIEGKSRAQLVDSDGKYLTSITDEAYRVSLQDALSQGSTYYTDVTLQVKLSYSVTDGVWSITADSALLNALSGHK